MRLLGKHWKHERGPHIEVGIGHAWMPRGNSVYMENHQALQKSNQIQLYATQTIDSEIAKKQQNETQSAERVKDRLVCKHWKYERWPDEFTMPVLCSLPYVHERLQTQLPSMLRRTMAERFLTTHIPLCRTAKEISACIAELARMMESNSRNIIMNYTNFVLSSRMCLETPIAQPNMFYNAFQRARESQEKWETRFSDHVQALDDLCGGGSSSSSSSSSSSAENLSLLQCAKELVECWKSRM